MSEENKQLARQWFEEVWNKKDAAAIDRLFHKNGRAHGFPENKSVLVGPEAFKEIHRNFLQTFPDLHLQLEDIIAEGDRVAVRWSAEMTHLGEGLGLAPTGKRVDLHGAAFIVIHDGQITDGWNEIDMNHLFTQLREDSI